MQSQASIQNFFQNYVVRCLVTIIILLLCQLSLAQFSVVGTSKIGLGGSYLSFESADSAWQNQTTLNATTGLDLDFSYELDTLTLKLIMEPSATLTSSGTGSLKTGLREVYASYRFDDVDVSVGLERLPLETARLSVPFSITNALDIQNLDTQNSNELKGFFDGIWSARSTWYLDDTQLRLAVFYREQQERIGGVASLKHFFDTFDTQVIIVYDDYFGFGLNGSTLIEDIVLYGESWFLLNPPLSSTIGITTDSVVIRENSLRALLGATGYIDDGLWTIEAGYMPSPFSPTSIPQLLAQYQLPQDAVTWDMNAGLGYVDTSATTGLAGLLSIGSNFLEDDSSAGVILSTQFTENNFAISIAFNLSQTFDYFSD